MAKGRCSRFAPRCATAGRTRLCYRGTDADAAAAADTAAAAAYMATLGTVGSVCVPIPPGAYGRVRTNNLRIGQERAMDAAALALAYEEMRT